MKALDAVAHEETLANDAGEFTFTRSAGLDQPLTVQFTVSGTATSGSDYLALPTSITFAPGQATVTVVVSAIDDSLRESAETVVLTINSSEEYSLIGSGSAPVVIADNETPEVSLVAVYTNMYERIDKDFARYRITRVGDTNSGIYVGLTYQGSLTPGVDFVGKDGANAEAISLEPGVASATLDLSPVDNTTFSGPRFGKISIAPAGNPGEYVIHAVSNSATIVIVDDELGTENVLFSEDFEITQIDTNTLPATWKAHFAATNAAVKDYSFKFGADTSGKGFSASPGSATYAVLHATVNKFVAPATAAALNFYPVAKSFSGNFALRMHMLLEAGTAANTEHALFGILHSGNKTNWFRASAGNVGAGYVTNMDGLFFAVNATGGNLNDYMMFTRGTGTGPLTLATRTSASMAHVFKAGAYSNTGAPGASPTPYWTDVEVAHTEGVVSMLLNNQLVFEVVNTNALSSGDIMIGCNDAYDSTGVGGAGYFDNVRVVSVNPPQFTTQPVSQTATVGGNATLSVAATGTSGSLSYQWLLNGAAIPNATNATLNLTNLQANLFGNYTVLVNDGRYSSVSAAAAISAAVQPELTVARAGTTTTLSFPTQTGMSYVVEYKDALGDANWTLLSTKPGTGSTETVTDTTTANARFYRLNVK